MDLRQLTIINLSEVLMTTLAKLPCLWHVISMQKKTSNLFLVIPLLLMAVSIPSSAQEPDPTEGGKKSIEDVDGPNRFWQATLPGGHYMVALDRISSISRHQYVLDGALIVDEVTVDSLGQALARFYFISPVSSTTSGTSVAGIVERGTELLDQAAARAGTDVHNMVVKKYPDTTHARTVEYRLLSKEQLTSLYQSLQNSWQSGKGRRFSAR